MRPSLHCCEPQPAVNLQPEAKGNADMIATRLLHTAELRQPGEGSAMAARYLSGEQRIGTEADPIAAILVFHDPSDWYKELQVGGPGPVHGWRDGRGEARWCRWLCSGPTGCRRAHALVLPSAGGAAVAKCWLALGMAPLGGGLPGAGAVVTDSCISQRACSASLPRRGCRCR